MRSSDTISRPSEIGSLIAHSNDESQFVGSSSGVFFVNTVRQAFAKSLGPHDASPAAAPEFPAPEDTIVASSESPHVKQDASRSRATAETRKAWTYDPHIANLLGNAPALEKAQRLMMMYFKLWHPLFPFLHGPSFLQAMEEFYSERAATDSASSNMISEHRRACWTTILQSVFNISSILQPDLQLAQESKITSPANTLKLVDILLNRHDILSLQALLALQLYLVATMSLRTASLLGGAILRSILHAGFHRCPYRYQQLNSHDRQLRKRIFFGVFYAIDRYLSQALGLPLGIQDSDIDVCLPGALECHVVGNPISTQSSSPSQVERILERATNIDLQDNSMQNMSWSCPKPSQKERLNREATLAGYVMYGKLTGRALELFHKSIQIREVRRSDVLYLVSDVHKWWNNLPSTLQGVDEHSATGPSQESNKDESPFDLSPFFSILYEHLILCINRPCLSLEPSSPDFCSGLQICISSARNILSLLKTQLAKGQALFWPGLLSAAYMAGLVIAFACQLGQYSLLKGCQEISDCCNILQLMRRQWEIAKHCHTALSYLLLNIQRQSGDQDYANTIVTSSKRTYQPDHSISFEENKRRKTLGNVPDHATHRGGQVNQEIPSSLSHPQNFPVHSAPDKSNTSQPYHEPDEHFTYNENADSSIYAPQQQPQQPSLRTPVPDISEFETLQWLDESSSLTMNFDLNMTDLFQNSSWDPMLFDAFTQGQTSPR